VIFTPQELQDETNEIQKEYMASPFNKEAFIITQLAQLRLENKRLQNDVLRLQVQNGTAIEKLCYLKTILTAQSCQEAKRKEDLKSETGP